MNILYINYRNTPVKLDKKTPKIGKQFDPRLNFGTHLDRVPIPSH